MKRTLCMIAVALAITILASGILTGCNANNSASAANAGKNTAKKIEATANRLEVLEDKDFRFPAVFGNNFFSDATNNTSLDAESYTVSRRINTSGYSAKHLGARRLNTEGSDRANFLDKIDDLYVLCADISAANIDCNEKLAEIKNEVKVLKELSAEMKKAGKKGKNTFSKFNYDNRELNASVTKLNRDRNRIKANISSTKTKGNGFDVEATTMRNLMVMNKVENRLSLLQDTHEKLVNMNNSMRLTLGKQIKEAPAKVEEKKTPIYANEKEAKVFDAPQIKRHRAETQENFDQRFNRQRPEIKEELEQQHDDQTVSGQLHKAQKFRTLPYTTAV